MTIYVYVLQKRKRKEKPEGEFLFIYFLPPLRPPKSQTLRSSLSPRGEAQKHRSLLSAPQQTSVWAAETRLREAPSFKQTVTGATIAVLTNERTLASEDGNRPLLGRGGRTNLTDSKDRKQLIV